MESIVLTRGERFKDSRLVHNQHGKQTLDEVAKATGVSTGFISEIEKDTAGDIRTDGVIRLAKHYGVSTDYLLGLSEIKTQDPEIRSVCDYTHLSEEVISLSRKSSTVSETLNLLAGSFDGSNILSVPLFKFASAFLKVVRATIQALPTIKSIDGNKDSVPIGKAESLETKIGSALYMFNRTCIDLPNSVLQSDDILNYLNGLEMKSFLSYVNDHLDKEAHNGEHQED